MTLSLVIEPIIALKSFQSKSNKKALLKNYTLEHFSLNEESSITAGKYVSSWRGGGGSSVKMSTERGRSHLFVNYSRGVSYTIFQYILMRTDGQVAQRHW